MRAKDANKEKRLTSFDDAKTAFGETWMLAETWRAIRLRRTSLEETNMAPSPRHSTVETEQVQTTMLESNNAWHPEPADIHPLPPCCRLTPRARVNAVFVVVSVPTEMLIAKMVEQPMHKS